MSRVLLVHQPTDGGVGRHVRDLANGLSERDHEVILCGPRIPDGVGHIYAGRRLDLERAVAPRADVAGTLAFARALRELRPDIVHAHSSKAGVIARLARIASPSTPIVYTPHGYAFAGFFSTQTERAAYRAIEYALSRIASRVLCVCEAEARLARSIGPGGRVRMVHNGIDPPLDGPVDSHVAELRGEGPVMGALTLLRPGKGLETLIDAMPHVLALHPRTQLAIVGEGPDSDLLRARARERSVVQAVHFLGPSAEPIGALRGMDVFVHPSWAESFPYVILEAMSLGRPIVASGVGGIPEALTDGQSGLLVPPRDAAALAAALARMLDNPTQAAQMGAAARSAVSERFTRSEMTDRVVGVYGEVASGFSP
jgi:glycosyltransferase involved in cell wall biosynthesis